MPRRNLQESTRSESIRRAIRKIEKKYPRFREPGYQPLSKSPEAEAFQALRFLRGRLSNAIVHNALFSDDEVARVRADQDRENTLLNRMGLLPISVTDGRPLPTAMPEKGASRSTLGPNKNSQEIIEPIPSLAELRAKVTCSQRQVAGYLRCTTRTIRNYVRSGKLNKTLKGRICCDDKLTRLLRFTHGNVVVR